MSAGELTEDDIDWLLAGIEYQAEKYEREAARMRARVEELEAKGENASGVWNGYRHDMEHAEYERALAGKLRALPAAIRAARDGGIEEAAQYTIGEANSWALTETSYAHAGDAVLEARASTVRRTLNDLADEIRALKGKTP